MKAEAMAEPIARSAGGTAVGGARLEGTGAQLLFLSIGTSIALLLVGLVLLRLLQR